MIQQSRGNADLRQLFGDPPEDVIVQVPGLRQIFDIARQLVFAAPLLRLG